MARLFDELEYLSDSLPGQVATSPSRELAFAF